MPTATFNRLNQKKKINFLREAYIEFSINTYQGASITNLVKTLGIAKGSVYQYFEDKDDLYRYLVEEVISQTNNILDKTCPYDGDEFYSWYSRVLLVELKYYLSFPAHAVLLGNVHKGVLGIDRALKSKIIQADRSRIKIALPAKLYNDEIIIHHLLNSPMQLFDLLTHKLNLAKIISSNDPVFLDSNELLDACNQWVSKLKYGL